jgi:hypothetical protein
LRTTPFAFLNLYTPSPSFTKSSWSGDTIKFPSLNSILSIEELIKVSLFTTLTDCNVVVDISVEDQVFQSLSPNPSPGKDTPATTEEPLMRFSIAVSVPSYNLTNCPFLTLIRELLYFGLE